MKTNFTGRLCCKMKFRLLTWRGSWTSRTLSGNFSSRPPNHDCFGPVWRDRFRNARQLFVNSEEHTPPVINTPPQRLWPYLHLDDIVTPIQHGTENTPLVMDTLTTHLTVTGDVKMVHLNDSGTNLIQLKERVTEPLEARKVRILKTLKTSWPLPFRRFGHELF